MHKPATTVEKSSEKQPQPRTEATREKEFNEAVDRIYRRYGTDLSAFTRDVQKELQKRAG
jgi:hypothetical protein